MTAGHILTMAGLTITLLLQAAGAIIWAVRLEGRINVLRVQVDAERAAREVAQEALTRFDESTQSQVEDYRRHTDTKIDALDRSISAKFEKVFDKLDGKQDKAGRG